MKRSYLTALLLVIVTAVLFAFAPQRTGSIKGSVNPTDCASQVWVISSRDTLRGGVQNGVFQVAGIKPGPCTLIIEGIAPYKQTVKTGIEVFEGTETNVGEIILERIK